ncbi:hypothetical protein XAC3810_780033 [Xanthomonas citri pv. citri]|uniref:Uncharacterized protein n=1 Tax=Xanthomonas citri pv. citri TaxID=611301 RepID=A0A0U5FNW5_XANCI|nr:hypothetical protein XAC902_1070227 [Xanthomonas citri pv. citri]CEE23562.1 hypothetical protein XAC908_1090189 [Xanthomonas citri pv. citri]CEE40737.1 hypothetical protein XAC3824_920228 [Xanthomonas citri pv. citri]CEE40973.1 hypothetical protein XAC9322_750033 [Xanthomonas citri pv. citri]CEE42434.1 hypothetical protein XAC1083_780032 [Xanthomonas citri pv. citri]
MGRDRLGRHVGVLRCAAAGARCRCWRAHARGRAGLHGRSAGRAERPGRTRCQRALSAQPCACARRIARRWSAADRVGIGRAAQRTRPAGAWLGRDRAHAWVGLRRNVGFAARTHVSMCVTVAVPEPPAVARAGTQHSAVGQRNVRCPITCGCFDAAHHHAALRPWRAPAAAPHAGQRSVGAAVRLPHRCVVHRAAAQPA